MALPLQNKMMNRKQLSFSILFLSAIVDGQYLSSEIKEIARYARNELQNDLQLTSIDARFEIPYNNIEAICVRFGNELNAVASEEQKISLVKAMYDVITADSVISDEERRLFIILGKALNIDTDHMLHLLEDIEM